MNHCFNNLCIIILCKCIYNIIVIRLCLTCLLRDTISLSIARSIWMPCAPAAMAPMSSWLMYIPRGGRRLCLFAACGPPPMPPPTPPFLPPGPQVGRRAPVRLFYTITTNTTKIIMTQMHSSIFINSTQSPIIFSYNRVLIILQKVINMTNNW